MIKQILNIAQSCASLNIMVVATADGGFSLTFIPKLKDGASPLLATPLTLKGTEAELEAGIAPALDGIQSKRETLAETVEAAEALLAQATKDAAAQATAKKTGKPKPAETGKSAPSSLPVKPDGEEDEDLDDVGGTTAASAAAGSPTASTTTATAAKELNLFA